MIEINLLPEELRKKVSLFSGINFKALDIKSIPILHIASGIGAVVLLIQILLIPVGLISKAQLDATIKRYSTILPQKNEADLLKAKVADINRRSGAIDELMVKRFSWAKKIKLLSDCVVPGIWLSELSYDERPVVGRAKTTMPGALVLSGYASGVGERGASLIGKFIKSMQDNKDFYADLDSVDLVSTKSTKVDNQDVMNFSITCLFK